jgi:hypothetical protein
MKTLMERSQFDKISNFIFRLLQKWGGNAVSLNAEVVTKIQKRTPAMIINTWER